MEWAATHKRTVRWLGLAGILGLGVAVTLIRDDAVVAIALCVALAGLLLAQLDKLTPRPKLSASFLVQGMPTHRFTHRQDVHPVEQQAIAEHEKQAALAELPPLPSDAGAATFRFASVAELAGAPTEKDHQEFHRDVGRYLAEVTPTFMATPNCSASMPCVSRTWKVRADNTEGAGVAKDLRLRLALPRSAFSELPQEDPEPPSLPTRPRWEKHALGPIVRDLFDPSTIRPIVRRLPRGHSESPRGGLKGPTYAIEGEDLIVEYTARHLGPGVHERSSHPIDLQALMTGRHEVRWTIYADGLTKPATGVLEIQVEEPTASGMPSRALDQLPELD